MAPELRCSWPEQAGADSLPVAGGDATQLTSCVCAPGPDAAGPCEICLIEDGQVRMSVDMESENMGSCIESRCDAASSHTACSHHRMRRRLGSWNCGATRRSASCSLQVPTQVQRPSTCLRRCNTQYMHGHSAHNGAVTDSTFCFYFVQPLMYT